jgi:hypothetical protein
MEWLMYMNQKGMGEMRSPLWYLGILSGLGGLG